MADRRTLIVGLLLAFAAYRVSQRTHELPRPTPDANRPDKLFGLDATLPRDFEGHPEEAQQLAGLLKAVADYIEEDGLDSEPQVRTVFAFSDLYERAMGSPPWHVAVEHSPGMAAAWSDLGKQLGAGPEDFDATRRGTAIKWLRAGAYVLEGIR